MFSGTWSKSSIDAYIATQETQETPTKTKRAFERRPRQLDLFRRTRNSRAKESRQENCDAIDLLIPSTAETSEISGDDLLKVIDASIRGYSIDVREELRSEIALAVLSTASLQGTHITSATLNLNPMNVRRIAKTVYKTMPDRFRHVSLDHRYSDGQRLEERLAG